MSDYTSQIGSVLDKVVAGSKGIMGMIDQMLYKSLVGFLKSDDYEAVATALDQLTKEKKNISIPPIYFVAKAHPNERARAKATECLRAFGQDKKISELTAGKNVQDATHALINEYGNFKS